jgi:catechol-2,3-dioxygenase
VQRLAADDKPAPKTAGAFFALSVADLKTSAQWYTDKLGLKSTMEIPRRDASRSSCSKAKSVGQN